MERNVKEQQEKMVLENQMHQATADQCKILKEEHDRSATVHSQELMWSIMHFLTASTLPLRLNSTYRQLLRDNENLQLDHKNTKSQLNSAKLDQTKLEAEFSKLKEQYQQLDITSTKLTNQCEVRETCHLWKPLPETSELWLIVVSSSLMKCIILLFISAVEPVKGKPRGGESPPTGPDPDSNAAESNAAGADHGKQRPVPR